LRSDSALTRASDKQAWVGYRDTFEVDGKCVCDRDVIVTTTAELLRAVNASDADGCSAVGAGAGVLMPPHHPSVHGQQAIVNCFRSLFVRGRFRFTFTSSNVHLAGDTTWSTSRIRHSCGQQALEDVGKGLHVYGPVTYDIWYSYRSELT
jgi:ketosteroid isomerase-like protein